VANRPTAIFVEVQGTTFDSATTTLTATGVKKEMSDVQEAGDHGDMEREGLITRFASVTDFDVADEPVTTTSADGLSQRHGGRPRPQRKSRGRGELQ